MFEHARKVEVLKRLEEKLGVGLWLHKDTRVKGEYILEKGSGRVVYTFTDEDASWDADYVVGIVGFAFGGK